MSAMPHQQHIWTLAPVSFKEDGTPRVGIFYVDQGIRAQEFFALMPALQELEINTKQTGLELSYQVITPYDSFIYYHPSAKVGQPFPNAESPAYLKESPINTGAMSVLSEGFFEWKQR